MVAVKLLLWTCAYCIRCWEWRDEVHERWFYVLYLQGFLLPWLLSNDVMGVSQNSTTVRVCEMITFLLTPALKHAD